MLKRLILPTIIGLAAAGSFPALAAEQAREPGFYAGIAGGANFGVDSDLEGSGITNTEAQFETGPTAVGTLGYAYGNGFRTEIEGGYRNNDIDSVRGVAAATGDVTAWNLMVNGLYDFDTGSRFVPYVGAGLGAVFVNYDNVAIAGATVDDDDTQFAYQGIAGVAYRLADNLQLFVDYRYLASTDLNLKTTAGAGLDAEFRNHTVLAGLRFSFGAAPKPQPQPQVAEAPPPPPPPPPPEPVVQPAPPPAPEMPMNYLVFFDWDRYDLTEEARRVVAAAANNALAGKVVQVQATGHADRSGPDAYNMKLSERRAETVRDELVRLGVPASEIGLAWKGEREPLVPTPDGVREPQNRRVEIVFE